MASKVLRRIRSMQLGYNEVKVDLSFVYKDSGGNEITMLYQSTVSKRLIVKSRVCRTLFRLKLGQKSEDS